ncbi:DUF3006 domain-containing protein [Isachenkonia alkalipeptolytica]|uniref:DUF3006 domain-containing protein n=1 Tax=Isachenkonia alkalipeptolytica TaxID=2565777 RepID=A0AA43XKK6_9CLOT|nr:DUF3006 domain-containing protein [Isachenkonia alkalipeptolytica]NBG88585.1 DUF3006 domain-containing protein [Isachenkonia alkalipeptolytica]
MQVIIDRFEGAFAVVELADKETVNMPRALLPTEAKAGDVIEIRINREQTKQRKAKMENRMKNLWKKT